MASKAAIVAEHRLMSLQGWKECLVAEYGREFDIAETLPHGDIGQSHQRPLEAAAKCEHGQYSALYCRLCTDLQHDNDYKVTSETAVERKEIFCERCTDRCRCKERRRYKF